jgi:hypothetical protein
MIRAISNVFCSAKQSSRSSEMPGQKEANHPLGYAFVVALEPEVNGSLPARCMGVSVGVS